MAPPLTETLAMYGAVPGVKKRRAESIDAVELAPEYETGAVGSSKYSVEKFAPLTSSLL